MFQRQCIHSQLATHSFEVREATCRLLGVNKCPIDLHLKVPTVTNIPNHLSPWYCLLDISLKGIVPGGVPSSTTGGRIEYIESKNDDA